MHLPLSFSSTDWVGNLEDKQLYKHHHRVAIVIPAYNEERFIGRVIQTIPAYVDSVIVVDDCSQDLTHQVAMRQGDNRVVVLGTDHNQGVGGAVLRGYRQALELACDIVVKMDADGQMDANYLPQLLDALIEQGYDYAKGNRFLTSRALSPMPRYRLFANVVLTFMTKLASGYWHVFDPQNGFTAVKAEVLRMIDFDRIHRGYFFENDMLVQLNIHRFRVRDVAMPARYGEEKSNANWFRLGITFPLLFVKRFFWRVYQKYVLRDFSPIALFLYLGLLLFIWGALFGVFLWSEGIITKRLTTTGTVMLSVLPAILGFQLLLQAIVLDIQETPR